jgi:tryptophan-rich sensory protein
MNTRKIFTALICISIPILVGAVAGIATATGVDSWYADLNKPSFNPPNWVFAPVWTTLYTLMGVSLFMIVNRAKGRDRLLAVGVFTIQLLFNFAWSFLFFYFHWIGIALIDIIVLWISIAWMIHVFRKIYPAAGYLQVPYLFWVSFATVLNASIWLLN